MRLEVHHGDHPDWSGKTVLELGGDGNDFSESLPDTDIDFDVILADSIFSEGTPEERNDLVRQLLALLAPGGELAFTVDDPQHAAFLASLYPSATIRPPEEEDEPYSCIIRRRA